MSSFNIRIILGFLGICLIQLPVALAQYPEFPADRSQPWVAACETAVKDAVVKQYEKAEFIKFVDGSEKQSQKSIAQTWLRGAGSFQRPGGVLTNFDFECAYNTRDGRVVSATFTTESAAQVTAREKKDWVPACEKAIKNKILGDHPNMTDLSFGDMRESQKSNAETLVTGGGNFKKPDGSQNRFNFECVYNYRDEKVISAQYKKAD
jgi:hypothetical protein